MNDDEEQYEQECCNNCKSFSVKKGLRTSRGFCLKYKKSVERTDVCGYHRFDVVVEYQMEVKPPGDIKREISSRFHN